MLHLPHGASSFLSRAFPAPSFLTFPTVGFDMSDHSVRFIELSGPPGNMKIARFGQKSIPEGVLSYGDIKDKDSLRAVLVSVRREHKLTYVRASLPEEKAFIFKTTVPILSAEETRENVAFQLEENVPIAPGEAVFDYAIIEGAETLSTEREVVVSVFPESFVRQYYELYKDAGLIPLSFEVEADAIARAIVPEGDKDTYMIADFGQQRTGLSIVSDGVVQFTSTVEVGGNSLTSAIQKNFNISWTEAEKLKQEGAFRPIGGHKELYHTLMNSISALKDEINKHYIYWHTHVDKKGKKQKPIKRIILVGGDSNLKGLPEYLSSALKADIRLAEVWVNAFSTDLYIPPISYASSLSFATTVGLALRRFD